MNPALKKQGFIFEKYKIIILIFRFFVDCKLRF